MDRRRAAGALIALAVCVASSHAAPTASNQTALDLYDGTTEGCYYNFQHYGEGDRIMTNEPCLNCTCHNRMLMCYLRVCPFTKPIGQDCTVEKRADQCCPVVTCPDVPVDLLTSTSTNSPAEYGATGVGKLDKYGCNINGKYFPEGSKVPPNPNNPCEHCYCIRNMTTCVMQECTLHVDGCTPIYHKSVCCPVRYSCDHPEDEMLLLDDMTTTVRPTPGYLLTTTTLSPVTQMSQDCVHEDKMVPDGALIKTEKACEHCYCMKGDIVCVVQECGTPMENEGKNCTSLPPREGQCCPDTYICEGDEMATELQSGITTEPSISEEITTLAPPRRVGVEGSGYRKETDESYTEVTPFETDTEGSGYDHEIGPIIDSSETDKKPTSEIASATTEDVLYITTTARTPILEEIEKTTEPDKGLNTVPSGLFEEESPETSLPERTTLSEEYFTETSIISDDKKGEIEDKTDTPEIASSAVVTDKHEESLTTTQPTTKDADIDKEVTGLTDHTEDEKLSTPEGELVTQSTPQFEHATPEVGTKAPSDDENEVKMTTELFSVKDDLPADKETSTETISEITTATEIIAPSSEESVSETETSDKQTTPSSLDVSVSKDSTEFDESSEDGIKQKEVTTESLLEIPTSKPHVENDIDTTAENIATTLSSIELTTVTKTVEPSEEVSEDISMKEKYSTTESSFEVTSKPEASKPSDSETVDKTTKEEEAATEPSLEISTNEVKLTDEIGSISTMQEKEITTEPSLEISSHAVTSDTGSEQATKDGEMTTESALLSSISDKVTELSELPTSSGTAETDEIVSTTEKQTIFETTTVDNKENEVEDSARIPGEGDCLVNSITYRNNSDVPSTNNCHTSCKCVSSIVKCDPIICSPPPEYMDNCQPTYDSPNSCCPTYICHSGETMPPQPDSHMSGTEKPVTASIFECHGDQCVIKQDTAAPSEKPMVSECETADCGVGVHGQPHVPETDKISSGCSGNDCLPSTEICANGDCQEQPAPPSKPISTDCNGNECLPSTEICANGECQEQPAPPSKPISTDCNGNECLPSTEICANGECQEQPAPPSKPISAGCSGNECLPSTDVCADGNCQEQPASQKPISTDCSGNECLPSPDVCTNGDCQAQLPSPSKPCDGDQCDIEPVIIPVKNIPLCENEKDCKSEVAPCEGSSCVQVDCSTSDCGTGTSAPSHEHEQKPEICTSSGDCKKQEDEVKIPCSDDSCTKKETGELENQLPVDCSGAECDKQKPDVSDIEKVDIKTDMPIKETEIATEITQKEVPSMAPQTTDESSVVDYGQTAAFEPHLTTMGSFEESTTKSDNVDESSNVDTGRIEESLESSTTTEKQLVTEELSEKVTHSEPVSHTTETSTSQYPAMTEVTKTQPQEETVQVEEEEMKPTAAAPEDSGLTSPYPQEQLSTKPSEMTTGTDKPDETELPEASETPTIVEESSVTDSREPTTISILEVKTEALDESKPETSTEGLSIATESIDKEKSELPEYQTTESEHVSHKTELEIQDVTVKIQADEKETTTDGTMLYSEVTTTKPQVSIGEDTTQQEPVKQQEMQTSSYQPFDESSSTLMVDTADLTTTESAHKVDSEEPEFTNIPNLTTSVPDKTKETDSDDIGSPTEGSKIDQSTVEKDLETTSQPELHDILSTTPISQEGETKAPFTNQPSVTYEEDKTKAPEIPVTEVNIDTLKPEMETTEKQKESEPSYTTFTTSYESATTSKEITTEKEDVEGTKFHEPVTEITVKETDTTKSKDTSDLVTEPSPIVKTPSTSQALSTASEIESTKSPEQDLVTDMPAVMSSTYSIDKQDTTETEFVSETPEGSTISDSKPLPETSEYETPVTEGIPSETIKESTEPQPHASVSEYETPVTEGIPSKTIKESTEPQPHASVSEYETPVTEGVPSETIKESTEPQPHASVSEDSYQTEKLPLATDSLTEEKVTSTEKSAVTERQEPITSLETSEEPSKTTSVSDLSQDSATEVTQPDLQSSTTKYQEDKEESTESSMPIHETTVTDVVVPSSEEPSTVLQTSKYPEDTVTESEILTKAPDQLVGKEKETTVPEKLFTTEGPASSSHTTKSDKDFTKPYPEKEEILTGIPVFITEQPKETETTGAPDLGPKIKDQESEEPTVTSIAPLITGAESESKEPEVTSSDISKDSTEPPVTESEVSSSTTIPESNIKDEEHDIGITTSAHVPTESLQQEPTQAPHSTISDLQTDELLEVTVKPQQSFTDEPQAITTQSVSEGTEETRKEITTESLIEATTPSTLEQTSLLPEDKTTETDEKLTKTPENIATEVPQVSVTTKLVEDTSVVSETESSTTTEETFTEKLKETTSISVKDSTLDIEKTTLKSDESVTESTQDIITKTIPGTGEDESKTTKSPIEATTKSDTENKVDITKEQETVTLTSETLSDIQPTTFASEIIYTEHELASDTLSELSTPVPEHKVTTSVPDTEVNTIMAETPTKVPDHEITEPEVKETSEPKYEITETTPYVVELEEHTHKAIEETSTIHEELEETPKPTDISTEMSIEKVDTTEEPSVHEKEKSTPSPTKSTEEPYTHDKEDSTTSLPSKPSEDDSDKSTSSLIVTDELTTQSSLTSESPVEKHDEVPTKPHDDVPSSTEQETEIQTDKTPSTDSTHDISKPEEDILPATSKTTTAKLEEEIVTSSPIFKPEAKPTEIQPPTAIPETPKPGLNEVLPTEEIPEDDGHFPPSGGASGYGQEPDYVEEDQAFGPGTCRYGGKVYVSAQQIPRDDPCDFCFCFRSDIICLQQSCPPPIHGCHEEPIQGFCCPRYECPVAMATAVNVTTTTTTTTTTLPPHFLPHAYKGAAQRRGCQIKGHTYKVGEVVRSSSGPCLHCTCGGDGQMKCDPKACTPEPMLRQMIAAAVSAKRRR